MTKNTEKANGANPSAGVVANSATTAIPENLKSLLAGVNTNDPKSVIDALAKSLASDVQSAQNSIPELVATSTTGYSYDNDFFYNGECKFQKNPFIQGEYLICANATTIKPPKLKEHQCAKYDDKMRTWQILPDFQGVKYFKPDGTELIFTKKGLPLPDGASLTKPPPTPTQAMQLAISALEQINNSVILKAKIEADFSDNLLALAKEYKTLSGDNLQKAKDILTKIADKGENAEAVVARILENEKSLILKKSELDALKIVNTKKIKSNLDKAYLVIVEHAKQLTPIYSKASK